MRRKRERKFKRVGKMVFIFCLIILFGVLTSKAQITIFSEDFNYPNGTTVSSKWTRDISNGDFRRNDRFEVQSQQWEARNVDGEAVWTSQSIDISNHLNINITLNLADKGKPRPGDYIHIYYRIDNGAETLFQNNGELEGSFETATASQTGLIGENLQIIIRVKNGQKNNRYYFDNINVVGFEISQEFVWTGKVNRNWHEPGNWNVAFVPNYNCNIKVPPTVNDPVISAKASCNNITIEPGATLTLSDTNRLKLQGNFTNDGKFITDKGTVLFLSDKEQVISGQSITSFHILKLQNRSATGLVLKNNVQVSGELQLKDGYVSTRADTLKITSKDAAALSVFSDSSYVVGYLTRHISDNDPVSYSFPVGKGGPENFYPAEIITHRLDGTSYITASFKDLKRKDQIDINAADEENTYSALMPNGTWILQPDVQPTGGWFDLKLWTHNLGELNDNQFGILKQAGNGWAADFGSTNAFGGAGRKKSDGFAMKLFLNSFSEFAIGRTSNLAAEGLPDFQAELQEGKVFLSWTVTDEMKNEHVTVEKSNGIDFKKLQSIKWVEDSSGRYSFAAIDENPYQGTSYYRLKQTDSDGKFSFSKMVTVVNEKTEKPVVVFPKTNPGKYTAQFASSFPRIDVVVYNQAGTVSMNKSYVNVSKNSSITIDLKNKVVPGIYYVQLNSGNGNLDIQKLVVN